MANLVTVADIATFMDIEFSNRQEDAAQMVIDGLEAELEAYLNRPVTQRTFTETYVVPMSHTKMQTGSYFKGGSGTLANSKMADRSVVPNYVLYLENSPVVSVTSLTLTAQTPGSDVVLLTEGTDFYVRDFGVEVPQATDGEILNVVYVAGLDGASIPSFKLQILRAAAREMQNMHDDTVGMKDLETRNVAPVEIGFSDAELRSLKRHQRRRIGVGLG